MTEKPVSEFTRSEIVRLPEINRSRARVRRFINGLVRLLVRLFLRAQVSGLENVPRQGPALIVGNHLGDADDLLKIAFLPRQIEAIAKIDLVEIPILGRLMQAYGVIWIRRGQPDRLALRAAIQGLNEGRMVMINPEGRESLSGSLEEATNGAAFLALKANAPILPIAITGTQNARVYSNMRRFRRTPVTFSVGPAFNISSGADRQAAIDQGTQTIMHSIATMLPAEYRGVYRLENT